MFRTLWRYDVSEKSLSEIEFQCFRHSAHSAHHTVAAAECGFFRLKNVQDLLLGSSREILFDTSFETE